MIKGRFFQSVERKAYRKARGQKNVQRAMKVKVGARLACYSDCLLRGEPAISGNPDAEFQLAIIGEIVAFGKQCRSVGVKARMRDGEHETAAGPEGTLGGAQQRRDGGDIHERHVADGGVEQTGLERCKLPLTGEIEQAIFDAVNVIERAPAGTFEQRSAEVAGYNVGAERREPTGELAIATRQIEHLFAAPDGEQAFGSGRDQGRVPFVALAHVGVPPVAVLLPNGLAFTSEFGKVDCRIGGHALKHRHGIQRRTCPSTNRQW